MIKRWLKDPKVGIDLGKHHIKGVELKAVKDRVFLKNIFFQEIQTDEKNISDVEAILQVNEVSGKKVSVAINDSDFESFEMLLPRMPWKDVKLAIERELSSRITLPMAEIIYDYYEIKLDNEKSKQITLKIIFSTKQQVDKKIESLSKAGVKVDCVDVNVLALAETLEFNGYTHDNSNFISLELGKNHTSVALLVGTQVVFTHTFPFAVGMVDDLLSMNLNYNKEDIKKINDDIINGNLHELSEGVFELFEEVAIEIVDGLVDTIDYYIEKSSNKGIECIFVSGGGAKYPQIISHLKSQFDMEAVVVNPFRRIEIFDGSEKVRSANYESLASHMCVAIGLALRGVG